MVPDVKPAGPGDGDGEQEIKHGALIGKVTEGVNGTSEDPNTKGKNSGTDETAYPLK
ncbi:hypothetical protein FRC06_004101 [Ceratobasidium sp. 370]|nr:hypothetical protein FRC06_004101 [Ceratobasidium sp. 370]